MLAAVAQSQASLYNITAEVEKNAILNRGIMETTGIEIPFAIMANNKDERIERFVRAVGFVLASFIAPVVTMPLINKVVLRHSKIIEKAGEEAVLRVSKKYLTKDGALLRRGFEETTAELRKNSKLQHFAGHIDNVIERFKGREKELRQKLIKAHQHIFSLDFAFAGIVTTAIPWLTNYFTERRTKRKGYVGEFKMAGKEYTDKTSHQHEKTKKIKMAISLLLPILPAILLPKMLARSMSKSASELGKIGRYFKDKAHFFDYKDAIFMSKAAYMGIWFFGDFPTYALACRDKHELNYKLKCWTFMSAMLFGLDPLLNNIVGRLSDKYRGTKIMNHQGFEKAGFLKKVLIHPNSLEVLKDASRLTRKTALTMYWGNFILTTALLGFTMPYVLNKGLKKEVTEAQKQTAVGAKKQHLAKMQEFARFNEIRDRELLNRFV